MLFSRILEALEPGTRSPFIYSAFVASQITSVLELDIVLIADGMILLCLSYEMKAQNGCPLYNYCLMAICLDPDLYFVFCLTTES